MIMMVRLSGAVAGVLLAVALVPAQRWPVTAAARVPDGWWIRVLPGTNASRIDWQFGATNLGLTSKTTSPPLGDVEVPRSSRHQRILHLQIHPTPPTASASFCLFWKDQGAALVETTGPVDRLFNDGLRDPQCALDASPPARK